jgi:hypothetical protein
MTNRDIYVALNDLMNACGLSGESGTEVLFDVLFDAVPQGNARKSVNRTGARPDVRPMVAD